ESVAGEFLVDTGLRGTGIMHTPFVDENDLIARSAPTVHATVGGGIGGRATAHVGRVRSLTLAGVTIDDTYLSFSQATSGLISTDYCSGIIGSAVLQRYRVAFDYPRGRILLWPADFDAERLDFDKSGMFLVADIADRSLVRVVDVIAGAPAAEAGLAVGNVILSVGGRRLADAGLETIRRMLRAEAGTVYEVEYVRGGETRKTRLTLRRVV
ncbi:MAG: PDZ domain-containing protein, partial [Candidatus Krumholzibacteria bacterium]|nr:PDZ domain-containing protein [Candidatus Krumholzibacteria bacterium]